LAINQLSQHELITSKSQSLLVRSSKKYNRHHGLLKYLPSMISHFGLPFAEKGFASHVKNHDRRSIRPSLSMADLVRDA